MDTKEEFIIDVNQDEWKFGGDPPYSIPNVPRTGGTLVQLPFYALPAWPVHLRDPVCDLYYCVCARCNRYTNQVAQVVLDFDPSWCVRILCINCEPELVVNCSLTPNIMLVYSMVAPIITEACQRRPRCDICLNENGCDDPIACNDVKRQLEAFENWSELVEPAYWMYETQSLLRYFYDISLDVCTPLRYKVCHRLGCDQSKERMINCPVCKRMAYCSHRCKSIDKKSHQDHCHSFRDIWQPS